jgi:hypothetical protein
LSKSNLRDLPAIQGNEPVFIEICKSRFGFETPSASQPSKRDSLGIS